MVIVLKNAVTMVTATTPASTLLLMMLASLCRASPAMDVIKDDDGSVPDSWRNKLAAKSFIELNGRALSPGLGGLLGSVAGGLLGAGMGAVNSAKLNGTGPGVLGPIVGSMLGHMLGNAITAPGLGLGSSGITMGSPAVGLGSSGINLGLASSLLDLPSAVAQTGSPYPHMGGHPQVVAIRPTIKKTVTHLEDAKHAIPFGLPAGSTIIMRLPNKGGLPVIPAHLLHNLFFTTVAGDREIMQGVLAVQAIRKPEDPEEPFEPLEDSEPEKTETHDESTSTTTAPETTTATTTPTPPVKTSTPSTTTTGPKTTTTPTTSTTQTTTTTPSTTTTTTTPKSTTTTQTAEYLETQELETTGEALPHGTLKETTLAETLAEYLAMHNLLTL